jgi:putative DNA methylase
MKTIYPKRLIEVDLPIKRISAHARREKSIRHGHISTLHIWWARRPLAACRAVICAALWPDPADPLCPDAFRETARTFMQGWAESHKELLGEESFARFVTFQRNPCELEDNETLRAALLDFIADFANWDNSNVREYLDTSRALTQSAHEALGGAPGTRPLVVDPFAGGGSIPLEALRVGADVFASDLNPVSVLLNKVVLGYVPQYGQRLADEVRKWGEWIKREAEKELAEFYPKDPDGATPIAYLWSRTIQCEGPGCGAEVPLIRSLWLAKKANRSVALQLAPNRTSKRVDFHVVVKNRDGWVDHADPKIKVENPKFEGTVKRGSATCQFCGYTTAVASVREQLKARRGGASDARMLCVVSMKEGGGRFFRVATDSDLRAVDMAKAELNRQLEQKARDFIPDEEFTGIEPRRIPLPQYGIKGFRDIFAPRQLLVLSTLAHWASRVSDQLPEGPFSGAIQACVALAVSRHADMNASLAMWHTTRELVTHVFGRQAMPMVWDFAEPNPFAAASGSFLGGIDWIARVLAQPVGHSGEVALASATDHPLPNNSVAAVVTDPPYYYSVPYSDLSDYFYVWLKRILNRSLPQLFGQSLTPKEKECVQNLPHSEVAHRQKSRAFYERTMEKSLSEARRVTSANGIGVVVFAHSATEAWESLLTALINAGWCVTGSWPIDTEMANRVLAQRQSTLASSVHLVCRPRQYSDDSVDTNEIGDWRDVLQELPSRIHEWMPRLAEEGVVGADAIFACIGPALEIFSRYSRVEKASGETVKLKEYLELIWAAVAKEALTIIFPDADTVGFEEDARLTAMWLWTLSAGNSSTNGDGNGEKEGDDESEGSGKRAKPGGFVLEYDAARKIAQGLGAHLETLVSSVEISGETARLLPVSERAQFLFGKQEEQQSTKQRRKKKPQIDLFDVGKPEDLEDGGLRGDFTLKTGETVLDRLHQSMILFGAGRPDALKRFLVEDGAGRDQRLWRLAQALAALYPTGTDERRWVEGVLARKRSLGF